jgi:hemoglobin
MTSALGTLPATAPTMYAAIGGADVVRALVDRFYDIMDRDPELAPLRAMHAADLAPMRDKLADWMSAFLGGPQHYFQRSDTVCFYAAHRRLPIDAAMRDRWLGCMQRALDESGVPPAVQAWIRPPLAELADFLRNR